ncbi:hypothetical protein Tco_0139197 [Tanacetum coccineum]
MFYDNSAALHFANEPGVQKGTRHYHRRYHYVHECIALGEIRFFKVHTDDNLADPFTKALPKGKLTQHARAWDLDHSSSGHSISGHSLSRHTPPDTTDADSSTPPRFVHPPLSRTPWCSEAYLRWRFAPLSTMYPTMTFESSVRDSSSKSSVGPSHKRCRSPTDIVTSPIHVTRALIPSRVDLLPSRKRFRNSISPEDSVEEDIDTDVLEDIEADATAVEVVVGRDVEAGIDAGIDMEVDFGVDVKDEVKDEVESSDRGTMEVGVDVVSRIDIPDAMLMPDAVECLEQVEEGLHVTPPKMSRSGNMFGSVTS